MTPLQIKIAMHYCTSTEDWPMIAQTESLSAIYYLVAAGLLTHKGATVGNMYLATSKLHAYRDALCKVELPKSNEERYREALTRLASIEAFTISRTVDPMRDDELLARVDYARKVLSDE